MRRRCSGHIGVGEPVLQGGDAVSEPPGFRVDTEDPANPVGHLIHRFGVLECFHEFGADVFE